MLLQANSVECGMNTGCLKIFKKAEGFDHNGNFIPPHKRGTDIQLFRGKQTDIQLFRGKQTDIQLFRGNVPLVSLCSTCQREKV